jgi:hypothetical protein
MFSEFFKRNDFRGINGNQRGEKEMWGWEKISSEDCTRFILSQC